MIAMSIYFKRTFYWTKMLPALATGRRAINPVINLQTSYWMQVTVGKAILPAETRHWLEEILASLGIMGEQFRAPLDTIVL